MAGAREILPQKLTWAPETRGEPDGRCTPALSLCSHGSSGAARLDRYHVYHYDPPAYGRAFGPLGLESTLRFCQGLADALKQGPVTVSTPEGDAAYHTNAAVMLGAFLLLRMDWPLQRLVSALGEQEADRRFPCSWSRPQRREPKRVMSVRHCWQGIALAKQQGWIDASCLVDGEGTAKACFQYASLASKYDLAWLVPGFILAGADPRTVIDDPNPITCSQMFPNDEKPVEVSTGSLPQADETREEDELSVDTVRKEYAANKWERETFSTVDTEELPEDFVGLLQRSRVSLVVQVNFDNEVGMPSQSFGYHSLDRHDLRHLRICVVDKNGGLPKPKDVAILLRACEDLQERDALMIHCRGGFGRSVLLACCLIISRFDVPGAALLGWARIVRPGAFTVRAQEVFLDSLRGRHDVLRYARMPTEGSSSSVSVACSPCSLQ